LKVRALGDAEIRPKCAALYLRVSTDGQTTETQKRALIAVAAQRDWIVTAVYEDAGISGAKGRGTPPGLDALLRAATRARFDVAVVRAVDRLGRSLIYLLETLRELDAAPQRACRSHPP
jgi:DNA invertase Pin-like site-specific DNA recombinase